MWTASQINGLEMTNRCYPCPHPCFFFPVVPNLSKRILRRTAHHGGSGNMVTPFCGPDKKHRSCQFGGVARGPLFDAKRPYRRGARIAPYDPRRKSGQIAYSAFSEGNCTG